MLLELRNTLTDLTSVGDGIVAVEATGEPNEQMRTISKLGEQLRLLQNEVERIEKVMSMPQNKVLHSPVDERLSDRVLELQQALDAKKQQLQTNAKLDTLNTAAETVTKNCREMVEKLDLSFPDNLNEQEDILRNLTGYQQQLERLVGEIPDGEEGKNLRDYIGDWLKRLKDFQQRLKDSVGNKLAAIAEFVALQTDVRNQLDSLKSTPVPDVFNLSVMSCNERLEELEVTINLVDFFLLEI